MPTIQIDGLGPFEAAAGRKLVLALKEANSDVSHRCGGNARCTTCRVEVLAGDPGAMTDLEKAKLSADPTIPENVRLSCQVRVPDGGLTVKVLVKAADRGWDPGTVPTE
jgi:ferredoxin